MATTTMQHWLERTLSTRSDVAAALVLVRNDDSGAERFVHWPADGPRDDRLLARARGEADGAGNEPDLDEGQILLQPVQYHGKTVGTLALRLLPVPGADAVSAVAANDSALTPLPLVGHEALLRLIGKALAATDFALAAGEVATELARALGCERVFIGMTTRRFVRIEAVSHGSSVAPELPLIRSVGEAMDESIDQGASIAHPQHPDDRPRITLAHAALAGRLGNATLLTVPMFAAGEAVGALTFERLQAHPFTHDAVLQLEGVAATLAAPLRLKHHSERSAFERARSLAGSLANRFVGERPGAALGVVACAAAILVVALFLPWSYHISAPTRLEGQMQRAIVAPSDSFLRSVHVRAGDQVKAGDPLAELADDDLRLELTRWQTEVARHETAFAEAQAKQDRSQLVMAEARAAETRAQLALVEQQIARTRLVAPFDAQIIKGDLTQQLGAPVKRGDLLLTLTPAREFRVMLEIDERDAAQVRVGTRGSVTLSALPDRSFELQIERVMPVARVAGTSNVFEAEARLLGTAVADNPSLRPGLQGVARLEAGSKPLWWTLAHRPIDWLRLQWWSWAG